MGKSKSVNTQRPPNQQKTKQRAKTNKKTKTKENPTTKPNTRKRGKKQTTKNVGPDGQNKANGPACNVN